MVTIEFKNYSDLFKVAKEKLPTNNLNDLSAKRLILAGNGSVENGWEPINTALLNNEIIQGSERIDLKKYVQSGRTLDALVLITHLKRMFRSKVVQDRIDGHKNNPLLQSIKGLNEFNLYFADELEKYTKSGILRFRPEIEIIKEMLSDKEELLDTLFLTLNWDSLAWNEESLGNVGYLHGNVLNPETMFMPSQYLSENAEFYSFLQLKSDLFSDEEKNILVKGEKDSILFGLTHLFTNCLSTCEELILWGIGLNIYDSDIVSTLSAAPFNNLKKIKIINSAGQREQILNHIDVLIPEFKGKIEYISAK
ncbi:hypothetical protein EHQ81_19445 [Leptospira selangorensis]|uniref:SIR2-like domain-containing protein n=1 Tax=Leptospira selangorensis TaxID=2484982 RepID=A0A5F2C6D5_9LEPT|nr:hypothetical protein [Leptospira selangorensis]TGM10282.1 hypothetical protein EHQ81_19445 [Leptospira selangorensis]TGM27944.1 hypothetical protein EHQ82_01625 [Leptospira selangorensis]